MARAAALSVVAGEVEGCADRMLWVWGCWWAEYRSVGWGTEVGAQTRLMVVQTLASRCLSARIRIRREQAAVIHPSQDLK